MTLAERIIECRWMRDNAASLDMRALYDAELAGLLTAAGNPRPATIFAPREYEWFRRGFSDGQTLLRLRGLVG